MTDFLAVAGDLLVPDDFLVLVSQCSQCWLSWCYGVSAVSYEHAVAGSSAVTSLSTVDGVLALASLFADHGVPILFGGFTYWTVYIVQCQ